MPLWQARRARRWVGEPEPPCCDVRLSVRFVTVILMSEMPAGDTRDVIHHGGRVVAVVVPIGEYQQLRQAMLEQVNEEFGAARVWHRPYPLLRTGPHPPVPAASSCCSWDYRTPSSSAGLPPVRGFV